MSSPPPPPPPAKEPALGTSRQVRKFLTDVSRLTGEFEAFNNMMERMERNAETLRCKRAGLARTIKWSISRETGAERENLLYVLRLLEADCVNYQFPEQVVEIESESEGEEEEDEEGECEPRKKRARVGGMKREKDEEESEGVDLNDKEE